MAVVARKFWIRQLSWSLAYKLQAPTMRYVPHPPERYMDLSFETLTVLSFLIPGFISVFLFRHLVYRPDKEIGYFIVEALIYSFVIYSIVGAILNYAPVTLQEVTVGDKKTYSVTFVTSALVVLLIVSVAIPLLFALILNNDYATQFLRKLRITTVSSRANTWLDAFSARKCYIIVNTVDGKRIFGWPMWYSNSPKDGYIYLYDPSWIDSEQNFIPTGLHGLFLVKEQSIDYIEFTNITSENAKGKDDPKETNTD